MSNVIIFAIIIVVVLLIAALLILIVNLGKNKPESKKRSSSYEMEENRFVNIQVFELPPAIEKISKRELPGIVNQVLRVYENLDYPKNIHEFTKPQWHTWQVSMLIRMCKTGLDINISQPERYFPSDLANKSDRDLRQIMNDILLKYKRDVETHRNRDFLSRDIIWSGRDVGIIFLFLSRYQSFPKELR